MSALAIVSTVVVALCLVAGIVDLCVGHGGSEEDYHRSMGDES